MSPDVVMVASGSFLAILKRSSILDKLENIKGNRYMKRRDDRRSIYAVSDQVHSRHPSNLQTLGRNLDITADDRPTAFTLAFPQSLILNLIRCLLKMSGHSVHQFYEWSLCIIT